MNQRLKWFVLFFISVNAVSATGAYIFTHSQIPGQLSLGIPRPLNRKVPTFSHYETQRLSITPKSWLETWWIPAAQGRSRGTVLLFPGNGGSKGSQLLSPAQSFHALGYDTLLVDFQGVGGSSGNSRTLGIQEAHDVATAFRYAQRSRLRRPLVLYGVSMGTAAILRAIAQEKVRPDAIILELPYARLLSAIRSRFKVFSLPLLGIPELLLFWGGLENGFNGFMHNPVEFARAVNCPALILQGEQDQWTRRTEIESLVKNLRGPKKLVLFPKAGHQLLVTVNKNRWQESVNSFLQLESAQP